MSPQVEIVEVGPRDGLQAEAQVLATSDKQSLIRQLLSAGVRRIEVASFVNPKRVPQLTDAEAVVAGVPPQPGITRIGLVLNQRGLERALAAGCEEVGLVASATDQFGLHNQGMSSADSVASCAALVAEARTAGVRVQITLSVAFGCPYEGEVSSEQALRVAAQLAALTPDELSLADTIGVAVPRQVAQLFERLRSLAPGLPLRGHFHNTRGTALANIMAAHATGVRCFDSSIGGIGGCPYAPGATGNVATEDVVYLLERSGIHTGLSLTRLLDTARWLEQKLGHRLPGMVTQAGGFPCILPAHSQ